MESQVAPIARTARNLALRLSWIALLALGLGCSDPASSPAQTAPAGADAAPPDAAHSDADVASDAVPEQASSDGEDGVESDAPSGEPLCLPNCGSRECGPDGCDGSCGVCAAGFFCSPTGFCDKPLMPAGWTCDASRWSDGATCDCGCSVLDPDCWLALNLPVIGCSGGQTCTPAGVCASTLPEWTLMVLLNGDNDLEYFAEEDLDEMSGAGSSPDVQVIVLADTRKTPTRTLRIINGGIEVLQENGELDLSDWKVLRDFGAWTLQHYPARRYALILSDHGSGWRSAESPPTKGISSDNSGPLHEISVAKGELANALYSITQAMGRPLDLLGFDACLLGNWEVATAVAPYAKLMVGSEETEPGPGWTYGPVLKALVSKPSMDAVSLAKLVVDTYHDKSTADSTLAAIDTSQLGALSTEVSKLAQLLRADPSSHASLNATRKVTLGFNVNEKTGEASLRDLGDLVRRMAVAPALSPAIQQQAQTVAARLDDAVVRNASQSPDYAAARGLSIYVPAPDACMNHLYGTGAGATWSQATRWDDMLLDWNQFDCGAWVCDGEFFGAGDGCDCNCGAWDPDCDLSMADVFHCLPGQTCEKPGVCAGEPIAICATWTCTNSFFGGNDGCDCECGCRDPDCDDPTEKLLGCLAGQQCDATGKCTGEPLQVCAEWSCDAKFFGASDGCDCACGCWDPDCDIPGAKIWHCEPGQTCLPPNGTCG